MNIFYENRQECSFWATSSTSQSTERPNLVWTLEWKDEKGEREPRPLDFAIQIFWYLFNCCWSLFVFLLFTLPAAYCLQIVSLRNSYLCMKREYRYQIFGHSNYWSSHSWTIGINNATARFKKDPLTHEQSRWTHCTKNTAALGNTAAARFQKCPLVHEQSG